MKKTEQKKTKFKPQNNKKNPNQCRTYGFQWKNALQKRNYTESYRKTGEMCCQECGKMSNIRGRKLEDTIINMKV